MRRGTSTRSARCAGCPARGWTDIPIRCHVPGRRVRPTGQRPKRVAPTLPPIDPLGRHLVTTMYVQVGGGPAIKQVVDQLYTWILADEQLSPYFARATAASLKRHMATLLAQVLRG